ncbi:polysaccharide deacetylase family protein [Novosphingobium flavum]|uniref:Polysaccharide deacetylase family protein n=1 Tax=Novosphingobium flavum TaxID=1778672 RepID=A0A7X1KKV5_9SPHN|nr:polysaccharide deacetylase family protein [Novosphingobium flavum]MBC2664946.1 polysaccharide deacetylase family protein [Novosphingobium flavum]
MPDAHDFVRFSSGFGQRFILTVDTEEEFDWERPLRANGHTLHSVSRLAKFQQFCEGFGIVPIYLVDYPVATSRLAVDILSEPVRQGRAEIGVQLHPWVSPPFEEEVNQFNSFAGNLSPELERAKFTQLRDTIERNFGQPPQIYRAGRYGVGPNTARILRENGIAIDTSVRSRFDYSAHGGPNFRELPLEPWWIDGTGTLMEAPLTTVYTGPLRHCGPWLYPRLWRAPRLRGALARAGMLDRVPFTPEGVTEAEILRGIEVALEERLPLLVFSFHSPSLQPGHTPYVRSEDELDTLYGWWRKVFEVLARKGVRPASIAEVMAATELA